MTDADAPHIDAGLREGHRRRFQSVRLLRKGGENRAAQGYPQPTGGLSTPTPDGVWWFTLGANGGQGEAMELVTMAPDGGPGPGPGLAPSVAVPAGNAWTLAGLCALLAGLGMAFVRSRR